MRPYDWEQEKDFPTPRNEDASELVRRGIITRASRADGRYEVTTIGKRLGWIARTPPDDAA